MADHCYAIAWFDTGETYTGALAHINAYRLSQGFDATRLGFTVDALWICTNGNAYCSFWVEEGWRIGARNGSSNTALTWYYAQDPGANGFYSEHFPGLPISLGTSYATKMSYNGASRFAFYRDGAWLANSYPGHPLPTEDIQVGIETTSSSAVNSGDAMYFQKRGANNSTWSYNWPGSLLDYDPPLWVGWYIQNQAIQYSEN